MLFDSSAPVSKLTDLRASEVSEKKDIRDSRGENPSINATKFPDHRETTYEAEDSAKHISQKSSSSSTHSSCEDAGGAGRPDDSSRSVPHDVALILTICFGQILALAPLGQVLGPLHIIGDSFNETNPAQLSWYMASYSLTAGTCVLVMGRLGDMFGHRKLFASGYAWLALWSLVAGLTVFTSSQIFFDVCRALQGLGGAMLVPNGLALLGLLYPPGAKKAIVFCLFGASAPTGAVTGALFSSLVAQLAWWPWAFFILAIIATVMVVAVFALVPPSVTKVPVTAEVDHTAHVIRQKFDWLGATTGVAGLVLFNVAWNQAPAAGWSSAHVLVLLVLGILLFVAFLVAERHADQPIVPVKEFSVKVLLVLLSIVCGWSGFGIWIFYWFQFVEVIQGSTPLNAVAQLSSSIPAAYVAALVTFLTAMRTKSCWIMLGAAVAFCAGSIITTVTAPETLYWKQLFWGCLVMPFGMDMSFPAATLMLSNIVPPEHQGIGASMVVTTVHYSMAFGLGIAGTAEVHFNQGGADLLSGYRAAQWVGVGLTGAGVLVAVYFVLTDVFLNKASQSQGSRGNEPGSDV